MGQFSRDIIQYGQALAVVKPPNNDPGSYIDDALLNPALGLDLGMQYELQARIDDLYNIMRGERDWFRK
jgi:hypothetical protein